MTDYIEIAMQLNNHGASLLADNEVALAFDSFKRALETLARASSPESSALPPPASIVTSRPAAHTGSRQEASKKGASVASRGSKCHQEASTASATRERRGPRAAVDHQARQNHFIYCQALVLDAQSAAMAPTFIPLYCAIIEFNLALTLQLRAAVQSGERALKKALYLYDKCLSHIQQALFLTSGEGEYSHVMVAAMNNMSVILFDLCDRSRAQAFFQPLLEIIMAWDGRRLPGFRPEQVEGVLLNVLLMKANNLAPAA